MGNTNLNKVSVGIDPGFTGAIGWIADTSIVGIGAYDMPLQSGTKKREFDMGVLNARIHGLKALGDIVVGLEYPTTRPKEGAEHSRRFGEGVGLLKGMMEAHQILFKEIPPNLWTGRLGIPGKKRDGGKEHNRAGAQLLISHYPHVESLIYGPRGGIKDGRLDALLIAHWMRGQHGN